MRLFRGTLSRTRAPPKPADHSPRSKIFPPSKLHIPRGIYQHGT
jgi:hypothetical protein